jgi:hypothetical protein
MDRKAKIREYKETPRPAGVFRILNRETGRTLLGSSNDAPARLKRERFQLDLGAHPNRALQGDWKALGRDAFHFSVDLLPPGRETRPIRKTICGCSRSSGSSASA